MRAFSLQFKIPFRRFYIINVVCGIGCSLSVCLPVTDGSTWFPLGSYRLADSRLLSWEIFGILRVDWKNGVS